jgi:hypothetical protein
MSKKASKAPGYAEASYDTGGLFGSSTSNKSGTIYNPNEQISSAGNTAWNTLNNSLQGLSSTDYSNDANFQAYQNQLYNTMGQQYDQMLGNLADRGLMRSTGLQALNNNYAQALQDNVTGLYDSYYNRQANNLSNLLNASNNLYNYMTGATGMSQANSNAVSNYSLQAYQAQQAADAARFGAIMNAAGKIGGGLISGGLSLLGNKKGGGSQ